MHSMKDVKKMSKGFCDFLKNANMYLLGYIGNWLCWLSIWLTLLIVPLAMLAIGGAYVGSCPMERLIPIYLVVFGLFAIIKITSIFVRQWIYRRNRTSRPIELSPGLSVFWDTADAAMSIFLVGWFIAGCIWIFPNYNCVFYNVEDIRFNFKPEQQECLRREAWQRQEDVENAHLCSKTLFQFALSMQCVLMAFGACGLLLIGFYCILLLTK